MSAARDQGGPPDAVFVRRRWVPARTARWAQDCAKIMREHGAVTSQLTYDKQHQARWKARYLIDKLVQLDLFHRWELREHTNRTDDGWKWTVEYLSRRGNG